MKLTFQRPSISYIWSKASRLPLGNRVFSRFIGRMAPYTSTISATVLELSDGHCRVELRDRPALRNHLKCIHAIALVNVGEVSTGLAVMHAVDGRGRGIISGLRVEYYKKARGTIMATCDTEVPTETGTHEFEVSSKLRNEAGELVAQVWATWKIDIK